MNRLKVLMSAYACEPDMGSEPGVGWNVACEMAKYHDVWVITRSNNREVIETKLESGPMDGLHFIYYDLPRWARWWKKGGRGIQLYYYLWQLGIYHLAKRLHRDIVFDLAHHVTFVKYWSPSLLALLPIPFLWGPVGGGESAPKAFWKDFSFEGQLYEQFRDIGRWLGERDPLVRLTMRNSKMTLVTTKETYNKVSALWRGCVKTLGECALNKQEIDLLKEISYQDFFSPIRFISIGRLLHWKGFHLGLHAFARSSIMNAEYWVIGDGPERGRLERIAQSFGMKNQVRFWGKLTRYETLIKLGQCSMLIHPSLHDSGGWVCIEAMAAGKPVICLDLGGPAMQVTEETGFKIPAISPNQVINSMAEKMLQLAQNHELRIRMGAAARKRVKEHFNWDKKGEYFLSIYAKVINNEN